MTSTLYQCLKYYRGKERKINDNVELFTKVDYHFTDVRFFEEDDAPKETMPSTIFLTARGSMKNDSSTKERYAHTSTSKGRKPIGGHIFLCQEEEI